MSRIRTLKPEWLDDESIAACSDSARLLSTALILLADDEGNGRAHPRFIAARVWAYSPDGLDKVELAMPELEACGFVTVYEAGGQSYFSINNWKKHQKISKPGAPRVPPPEPNDSAQVVQSPKIPGGNTADLDLDHDLDHDQHTSTSSPVRVVFDAWVRLTAKNRKKARLNAKRRQRITARLREGYTPAECIQAIANRVHDPWLMGKGKSPRVFDDIDTLLRDGAQLERLRDLEPGNQQLERRVNRESKEREREWKQADDEAVKPSQLGNLLQTVLDSTPG